LLAYAAATGDKDAERTVLALTGDLDRRYRDPAAQRYVGAPADAGAAFWARLPAPTATSGELTSPEAAMLTAVKNHESMRETAEQLRAIVTGDLKNAADAAAGEFLLALSPAP
jgi:hypothetical protein